MLITPLFPHNLSDKHTNQPITFVAPFPGCLPLCFLDCIQLLHDFESCMWSEWETDWWRSYRYASFIQKRGGRCLLCLNARYAM